MSRRLGWVARVGLAALVLASCGDDEEESSNEEPEQTEEAPPEAPAAGPLLEEEGSLAEDDASDARGRYDRYFVDVRANDRLVVELRSSAFDPILEVTPPSAGTLVNDDYEGDTSRSRLELISSAAGQMKIEVRAYANDGAGAYTVTARRVASADEPVPHLTMGQSADGEIASSDHALSGGDRFDSYVLRTTGPARVSVRARGGEAPSTTLVGPDGLSLEPRDGGYDAPTAGTYRLQVLGPVGTRYTVQVGEASADQAPLLARAHHQFNRLMDRLMGRGSTAGGSGGADPDPGAAAQGGGSPPSDSAPAPRALPVRIGDRLNGNLGPEDPRLPSDEFFDVYELTVGAADAGTIAIELESTAFDCFLRVDGPGGEHWENDDHGGTLNSRVEVPLTRPGTYRIVTTSYQAGETGGYELKVLSQRDTAATGGPGDDAPSREIAGALEEGDPQLRSGEWFDAYAFEWPAGTRLHLAATSADFDTYLIVQPPGGAPQQDNDDERPGESLDAGMDFQAATEGTYRVLVTSYQPGETGSYTLAVRGSDVEPTTPAPGDGSAPDGQASAGGTTPTPTPPPANATSRTETGNLAQGDRTLQSGEFVDSFPLTFTANRAVQLRLESSDFDTYLIVRSPSGDQTDNDDLHPGAGLNSGIDIPVAEPGTYQVMVTSYRPGETGRYTLRVTEGDSVVAPPPPSGGGSGTPSSGGGRVWGLFAGITDYPGQTNDLPECANDARKLAEAIRNQGNMPSDQEFLLTDAQATTANIRQAMQTVASRIRPDDVFVFFYSGHGGQTDSSQDRRELDSSDEYLFVYDGQLMDDELGRLFDGIEARVSLVAIDACFAGGFAKDVITRAGRVGMFSSEEDVTSAVAGRFQAGGYLSHFLRVGIQGEADNDPRNRILTVGELTHYTWRQFGQHASDVRMSMGYQHLVVDRGAVPTTEVLWAVRP